MVWNFEDLKFAHSIAKAVASDAVAIEESRVEETQSVQDRDFGAESVDWDHVLRATEASTLSNQSCGTVAGPSDVFGV